MTTNVYQKGDTVRLSATFRNTAGNLADPTNVIFRVTNPAGVTTSYTYLVGVDVVRDATGTFHLDVVAASACRWKYQTEGTGNGIQMVENNFFDVEPSAFA